MRRTRLLFAAWTMTAAAVPAAAQHDDPPRYIAGWQALAQPEQKDLRVAESRFVPILSLRPDRLFTVGAPVVENGATLLAAGTVMIGLSGPDTIVCEFERLGRNYASLCLEDKDRDGRFETAFYLSHTNPFLFSGFRLRGGGDRTIQPVTIAEAPRDSVPVQMVLHYFHHGGLTGGTFEFCVTGPNKRVEWGCTDKFLIRDGAFPKTVPVLGREVVFQSRDAASVTVTVNAADADQTVRL